MPFSIRPFHRFPVPCAVTYHAGPFQGQGTVWSLSCTGGGNQMQEWLGADRRLLSLEARALLIAGLAGPVAHQPSRTRTPRGVGTPLRA